MICPRCSTTLVKGHCPTCEGAHGKEKNSAATIPYEVSSRAPEVERSEQWRQELLLRVDRHRQRTKSKDQESDRQETASVDASPSEETPPAPPVPGGRREPQRKAPSRVFRYQMSDDDAPAPVKRVLTYRTEKRPVPNEKPVIRPIMKAGGRSPQDERQGNLKLKRTQVEEKPVIEAEEKTEQPVFPEILFSRLLAGLIDIVAALIGGGGAVVLTFRLAGFDLFSARVLTDILIGVSVFYLFNSTFFLYLSGQTLGMLATELKLVAEDGAPPALSDILLRVTFFPLVAGSLLGLLWALFDKRQLCWHDYASRTRVVPQDHPAVDEKAFPV